MSQTVTIDSNIIKELVETLRELKEEVVLLRRARKLKYGSDEWWDEETRKGVEDFKKGRYTTIHNKKELREFLTVATLL
jgi:hypothetical protein